jgi:hydroxymethylbilane synthase
LAAGSSAPSSVFRLATRGSELARWQADEVRRRLQAVAPGLVLELVVVSTTGDRVSDRPVWEMGGQGVFVREVQEAVLDGRADAAVHSAKDLPSVTGPGLVLGALPVRADARDALVGAALSELRAGAVVATGSVRRRAQLAWMRPDLTFTGLRGNIATRLGRVPVGGAVVVASAALHRLGLIGRATEILEPSVMLPQVGQGAIAVECRESDPIALELLAAVDDRDVRECVEAERAFLARLGGGCDLPVGALARLPGGDGIFIDGLVASPDGRVLLRSARSGSRSEAAALGWALAGDLLEAGGADLMERSLP